MNVHGPVRGYASRDDQIFSNITVMPSGCWEWNLRRRDKGYGQVKVDGQMRDSHIVAHWLRNGPVPEGLLVCHHCDNPPCCNPEHLFVGTHQDNCDDKMKKGRHQRLRGEQCGTAKLTEEQVREIRRLRALGMTNIAIGDRFGMSNQMISYICLRRNWSHVDA